MSTVPSWCKRYWKVLLAIYVVSSLWWGPAAEAAFHLTYESGHEPTKGLPALVDVVGLKTQPAPVYTPRRASGTAPGARMVRILSPASGAACQASYYSGARGASGSALVGNFAAHKTAPFHSHWRVSGPNGSVVVEVLDRGPFISGRCWDLSPAAFSQIASLRSGVAHVTYSRVD